MQWGGWQQAIMNIRTAQSPEMNVILSQTPEPMRSECVAIEARILDVLEEEWSAKFGFYACWPYKLLCMLAPYFGGNVATSKHTAGSALQYYDSLHDKSTAHRVMARFTRPDSLFR